MTPQRKTTKPAPETTSRSPGKAKGRRSVTLGVTVRAERVLSRTRAETGVTQVALLERLLEWYAAQDTRVRTMILSPYVEVRRGLAKALVEQMLADPAHDFDPPLDFHGLVDNDFAGGEAGGPGRE